MFLKPNVLNGLMKEAYKNGGLRVGRTEDDRIYIGGLYWEVEIIKKFIPKKTIGDICALVGELPDAGVSFEATKDGNQYETGMPVKIDDREFNEDETLTITDLILFGTGQTPQRLLQDESTGKIFAVNNAFIRVVENCLIDKENGECEVAPLMYQVGSGILWKNNVCKLRAHFRADGKNDKILKELQGADITPEKPE